MATAKERAISVKQKMFVRAIVCEGMNQGEAYIKVFGEVKFPDSRASHLLKKASIENYKNELSQKMEAQALAKGVWTREIAAQHLLWVLDLSKKDLEEFGLNRSTLAGVMKSVTALNKLYGLDNPPPEIYAPRIIFKGESKI